MTKLIHVNKTNSSGYSNFTVYLKSEGSPINLTLAIFDIIDLFFNESIKTPQSKYFVLLKIMIDEFQFKTLHKGKIITIESKEAYKEFVSEMLSFKGSDYQDLQPAAIIFDYFELPLDWKSKNDDWTEISPIKKSVIKLEKFGKFNLPIDRNYNDWGTIVLEKEDITIIQNNKMQYIIHNEEIEVLSNNTPILTFKDTEEKCGSADFVRIIDNKSYYIKNNEIVLTTKVLPTSFLTRLTQRKDKVNNKIITFDIETIVVHKIKI